MTKGFSSFLFLFLVGQLLVTIHQFQTLPGFEDSIHSSAISLKRLEMENLVDEVIDSGLHEGLILHEKPELIKNRINSRIIGIIDDLTRKQNTPIVYQTGFSLLQQTQYLALLDTNTIPVSLSYLNECSHVLVLPIDGTNWYGEYTYTGCAFGSTVFLSKIHAPRTQTLFALPIGYHACATTITGKMPCQFQKKE